MSLNRFEQAFLDYLRDHPDEGRHWQAKISRLAVERRVAAMEVAEALWEYSRERGAHVEPFREWAARGGVPRSSLRNLAEYLLRVWGPPVAVRNPAAAKSS